MRSLCDHSASTKRSKSGKKNTSSEDSESDYLLEEENQGEHDDDDESLEEEQPRPLRIEVLLLSWCRGLRFFFPAMLQDSKLIYAPSYFCCLTSYFSLP